MVRCQRAPKAAKKAERTELVDDYRRMSEQVTSCNDADHCGCSHSSQVHRVCPASAGRLLMATVARGLLRFKQSCRIPRVWESLRSLQPGARARSKTGPRRAQVGAARRRRSHVAGGPGLGTTAPSSWWRTHAGSDVSAWRDSAIDVAVDSRGRAIVLARLAERAFGVLAYEADGTVAWASAYRDPSDDAQPRGQARDRSCRKHLRGRDLAA